MNVKKYQHNIPALLLLWGMVLPLLVYPASSLSNEVFARYSELDDAGVLLLDKQGQPVISSHAKRLVIPASTTKLLTAWLALKHWGEEHHFRTHFYLHAATNTLWVKGSGDPFLVSEELALIAKHLKQLGISNIDAIGLDVSLFQSNLKVPGAGRSGNPYDAIPTAVAANFNTIAIKRMVGKIVSAESQTPLTSFARRLIEKLPEHLNGKEIRINTGANSKDAEQYFAELLAAFLRQHGVTVGDQVVWGVAPKQAVFYTHINSKSLAQVLAPMMKYSTNFIANQLVLMLSADTYQRPANFADVQRFMQGTLADHFMWTDFTLKDGAGLSRENKLSPQQLVQLLDSFRPWKYLLPEVCSGIYAKSGTLNKVSTLAGFVNDSDHQWQPFALMMNQSVRHQRRNMIAREIVAGYNSNRK